METVGIQTKLPFGRAFQIAAQGIKIRLGRSMVTVSGVVLGVAFLMNNLTAQLIRSALAGERERRQTVTLMETVIRGEIGTVEGKTVAVARFGDLETVERELLARIRRGRPAELRGFGLAAEGIPETGLENLADGASLLLVLGNAPSAPVPPARIMAGMVQKVALDSQADRTWPGEFPHEARREIFFGKENEERLAEMARAARQARFRTIWITVVSILVTIIGVSNALLMSVSERFREIGTMKCLGALSEFIRRLFLIESAMVGLTGSVLGAAIGAALPFLVFGLTFGFAAVGQAVPLHALAERALAAVAGGTLMSMLAAIYPAIAAARMVPAAALRSNV